MSFKKSIVKNPLTQAFLSWLLALYIRLVFFTSRIERHIDPDAEKYMRGKENALFAFWHGRMMLLPAFCPPKRQMRVLISLHRDGKLISDVIGHFGQKTINGSTSRGGQTAVMEILRALEDGDNISITPDGPRGPVQVLQLGVVSSARLSGKPILPVTFSATRHVRFRSWDRFMLALPFSRIAFLVGAPILIDSNADGKSEEHARQLVEQAMNALVIEADEKTHVSQP